MATAQLPILRQPVNEECIYDESSYILNQNPMAEEILPSGFICVETYIAETKKDGTYKLRFHDLKHLCASIMLL